MAETKKYWRGIEELTNADLVKKVAENEFPAEVPTDEFLGDKESLDDSKTSRRDFLKYMGFSTAAATLAACEAPVVESIPYVSAPEEIIPGIPDYYATSYFDGHDYASVVVKSREGRPIKIENNKMAKMNGGANARVHASVLNLYDSTRLHNPLINGEEANWSDVDAGIKKGLDAAAGKQVVLLTSTVISPSTKKLIKEWGSQYSNFKHVMHDAYSYSGKLDAIAAATGKRALPTYNFKNADVIVSFNSDFLGSWVGQSVSSDYATRRKPGKNMSRHIQFESNLSLTGSNADQRYKLKPSEMGNALITLYKELGGTGVSGGSTSVDAQVKKAAAELKKAGSNGLVVCDSNDADIEAMVIAINDLLGNRGNTIDYSKRSYLRQGDDSAMNQLISDMNGGNVGALLIDNLNPVYRLANDGKFAAGMEKVGMTVAFSEKKDETAALCQYVCAKHNYLESWGDHMPADGIYSLQQPVIRPLFNTRQMETCLLKWSGKSESFYDYLTANWANSILGSFAWKQALQDGVFASSTMSVGKEMKEENGGEKESGFLGGIFNNDKEEGSNEESASANTDSANLSQAAGRLAKAKGSKYEIHFYQKQGIGVGYLANNPWLQELPDPITRASWDNYLTISAADASELGVNNWTQSNGALNGDYVKLTVNGKTIENVPVFIQPGQAMGTVGLALGYGRKGAGKVADGVGVNAFELMNGQHTASDVKIEKMAGEHGFACVQIAHTMMGRKIVNETSLDKYLNEDVSEWNETPHFETYLGPMDADNTTIWNDFDHETGMMWNMSIDLNLCNGCGACVIACHSENNVPVVGKDEVRRLRDMHWLRIDRYYSIDKTDEEIEHLNKSQDYNDLEIPSQSPEVVFQPVMCQHCNHAPCETVCPVAATTHSSEGLNHMTYNRCIGTRYCANNCPYKVRRFNWFQYNGGSVNKFDINYAMNDDLGRMVLNPDVTVRARGVMEKCSLCIQRIQLGKLTAKKEDRKLKDGEVQTACQAACDTEAIVFGNVNDQKSKVFELKKDKRMYHLLEEIGTQPSVFYQTKVRNRA